jgi:hypothetical protein
VLALTGIVEKVLQAGCIITFQRAVGDAKYPVGAETGINQ